MKTTRPYLRFGIPAQGGTLDAGKLEAIAIPQIGVPGFCALKLVQRLLDPVPAGNCKLQTLRQYYRLPENGAHTALGDVLTVIDLMQQVLRPLAEKRGLDTWEKIVAFAGDE